MEERVLRAALYARVSTDEQAQQGYSLRAQMERLEAFAAAKGWHVSGRYIEDGASGRTTKRPEYLRMMADQKFWDIVVIVKLDRIHRSSRNFIDMMDKLYEAGKGFASINESFDTKTAMGRFVMDIVARIAQLESEQLSERIRTALAQKRKEEGRLVGRPRKDLTEDELTLAIRLKREGEGIRRIALAINKARGAFEIADPGTRRRKMVGYMTVDRALRNLARPKTSENGAESPVLEVPPFRTPAGEAHQVD